MRNGKLVVRDAREAGLLRALHIPMHSKSAYSLGAVACALLLAFIAPPSSRGDADPDPALLSLIKDVTAQQKTIVENQAKIDEKLSAATETLRQARIFVSRGGR